MFNGPWVKDALECRGVLSFLLGNQELSDQKNPILDTYFILILLSSTQCVAKDGLELVILLPLLPGWWGYRYVLSLQVYLVLG